jgi:hypothetical protein
MRIYSTPIFNVVYLKNKLIVPNIKESLKELISAIKNYDFKIAKVKPYINPEIYNLPLIKETNIINKVAIYNNFKQTHLLRYKIRKNYKPILTSLLNIYPSNLYYYSKFIWSLNNFDNKYLNLSLVSGIISRSDLFIETDYPSIDLITANASTQYLNFFISLVLERILPKLITDSINSYRMEIYKEFNDKTYNLTTLYSSFLNNPKNFNNISNELSDFLIRHIITATKTYSDNLKLDVTNIVQKHLQNIPNITLKFNKNLVIDTIYEHQLNQLIFNNIKNPNILKEGINVYTYFNDSKINNLNLNDAFILYSKSFNNQIVNNIAVINSDLLIDLNIIAGEFKKTPLFLVNSFYFIFSLAFEQLKNNFNDELLPADFSKNLFKLVIDNIDINQINFNDFKSLQVNIVDYVLTRYFDAILDTYISEHLNEFFLDLLNDLKSYNIDAISYHFPTSQYFKLLLLNSCDYNLYDALFYDIYRDFINKYTSLNVGNYNSEIFLKNYINRYDSIKNSFSSLDKQYYDTEIFNFFYNCALMNIINSIINEYISLENLI